MNNVTLDAITEAERLEADLVALVKAAGELSDDLEEWSDLPADERKAMPINPHCSTMTALRKVLSRPSLAAFREEESRWRVTQIRGEEKG